MIELKRPFFISGEDWMHGAQDDTQGQDKAMQRACSIATNQIYVRDKNDVAHVVSELNGWEVVEHYERLEDYFCYFFKPVLDPKGYQVFKPKGRWIEGTNCFPFHILYLYEEKMELLPDEE